MQSLKIVSRTFFSLLYSSFPPFLHFFQFIAPTAFFFFRCFLQGLAFVSVILLIPSSSTSQPQSFYVSSARGSFFFSAVCAIESVLKAHSSTWKERKRERERVNKIIIERFLCRYGNFFLLPPSIYTIVCLCILFCARCLSQCSTEVVGLQLKRKI